MKEEAKRFFETGMEKDFMNLSISEISARLDARLDRNKGIKINGIKYLPSTVLKAVDPIAYKASYDYYKIENWEDLEELDQEERIKMEKEDRE